MQEVDVRKFLYFKRFNLKHINGRIILPSKALNNKLEEIYGEIIFNN